MKFCFFLGKRGISKAFLDICPNHIVILVYRQLVIYGKKHTTDTKGLMSKWKTDVDYHMDNLLTPSSPKYRIRAFEKYGVKCESCGTERAIFEVHHIDGNHYNDDIKNLVVLCKDCHHTKAHIMTGQGKDMVFVLDETFKNRMKKLREVEE